jgi:hypothetical protein
LTTAFENNSIRITCEKQIIQKKGVNIEGSRLKSRILTVFTGSRISEGTPSTSVGISSPNTLVFLYSAFKRLPECMASMIFLVYANLIRLPEP